MAMGNVHVGLIIEEGSQASGQKIFVKVKIL